MPFYQEYGQTKKGIIYAKKNNLFRNSKLKKFRKFNCYILHHNRTQRTTLAHEDLPYIISGLEYMLPKTLDVQHPFLFDKETKTSLPEKI